MHGTRRRNPGRVRLTRRGWAVTVALLTAMGLLALAAAGPTFATTEAEVEERIQQAEADVGELRAEASDAAAQCEGDKEGEKALDDAEHALDDAEHKLEDARKKLEEAKDKRAEGKDEEADKKLAEADTRTSEAEARIDEARGHIDASGCAAEPESQNSSSGGGNSGGGNSGSQSGGKDKAGNTADKKDTHKNNRSGSSSHRRRGSSARNRAGNRPGRGLQNVSAQDITVDGNIGDFAGGFENISYTRDQGGTFTGALAVIETPTHFYFGFQQALNAKSNAYCADKKNLEGTCFQDFGNLRGSDYISFQWGDIYVPIDIISETDGGFVGGVGTGDGGDLEGIDASAVQGFSALHYNMNSLGWTDTENSPNFAGQPDHPYIYPSIAEVGLTKAGLPASFDLAGAKSPVIVVHNSPAAPTVDLPSKFIHISCPPGQGAVGENVRLTITVTENGVPKGGEQVLVIADGPGRVESVGGTPGNTGRTGPNGAVEVVVTSSTAGTTNIRGVLDVNGNGQWDQATEPTTEPVCPVRFQGQPPNFDIGITKTVDKDIAPINDELLYTVTVTNTGEGRLTNVVLTDDIPVGTTYAPGSASDSGSFDAADNALTWNLGSLAVGASRTVTFRVTINPGAPAIIE
ncbi:MAG: hypothetical protein ACRDJI_11100, partial [Actinomycetota bacterium]